MSVGEKATTRCTTAKAKGCLGPVCFRSTLALTHNHLSTTDRHWRRRSPGLFSATWRPVRGRYLWSTSSHGTAMWFPSETGRLQLSWLLDRREKTPCTITYCCQLTAHSLSHRSADSVHWHFIESKHETSHLKWHVYDDLSYVLYTNLWTVIHGKHDGLSYKTTIKNRSQSVMKNPIQVKPYRLTWWRWRGRLLVDI